ncbi:MAG TPA: hypothetical protein VF190_10665, partial [Rhodothermales bacterium]
LETTRHILEQWPPDQRPAIVALTADVTIDMQTACRDAGMSAFLGKPVDRDQLASVLRGYEAALAEKEPGRSAAA